jgi:predicted TIM-barrel fold metal-dependent hydrolase
MLRFAYKSFLKDNGDGNAFVSELAHTSPDLIVPFLWVSPLDSTHMANLEVNLVQRSARGIKLHQAWDAFTFDCPQFKTIAEHACLLHLPIFVHIYSRVQARKLLFFLLGNPDLVLIAGHLAGVSIFREYRKSLPNLYFDTSGSERIQGKHILEAINLFGSDHVLFGSDTPYAEIDVEIAKIDRLHLPDDVKESVFRKNALRILSRADS